MTLDKCIVLRIGTLTGCPLVQGKSPPVQVKEHYVNFNVVTCRLSSCNPECTKYTCRYYSKEGLAVYRERKKLNNLRTDHRQRSASDSTSKTSEQFNSSTKYEAQTKKACFYNTEGFHSFTYVHVIDHSLCQYFCVLVQRKICNCSPDNELFAYWVILHACLSSADFFNLTFSKKFFRNTLRVSNCGPDLSNSLDLNQAQRLVGPNLGPTVCKSISRRH